MIDPIHFSSDSDNWVTPEVIINAVIQTMGAIELDPCSPSDSGPVPAKTHFTKETDGLNQEWFGRVYMNPPYGRNIRLWVEKAISEYESRQVSEAILLLPARTDTKWFQLLGQYPWCAVKGRLKFSDHENSAPFPSAVFYLGKNYVEFIESFSPLGIIWEVSERAYSWPNVPIRDGGIA